MDEGYRAFKRYLRGLNKDSFLKLCEAAGLREEETMLVRLYYCDGKTELYSADVLGMSLSAYHNARMEAVDRIRNWLHLHLYRPEITTFEERIRIINEFLYKNTRNCS